LLAQHATRGLNIGVTGHRLNRISQHQLDRLTPQVQPVLAQAAQKARAAGAASLMLVCGLAEGADRHVARLALDEGYGLHAVLPFDRDLYARDFPAAASRREFDALLRSATRVTELPGRPGFNAQAYHRAAQALLDCSDLLLAIWDGRPAQGPGGTAEVVDGACARRMPVVHVSTGPRAAPVLLWQRQGRASRGQRAYETAPARRCGPAQVAAAVSRLMRSG
jgi:hypothetical protein